jgi:UDP-N-acetylglucosamine 1-carboxyvinyltransferase
MSKLHIKGGKALSGEVEVSGSKNAALPLLLSSLLTSEQVILHNVPDISDVRGIVSLLSSLGVSVARKECTVTLSSDKLSEGVLQEEIVKNMRAPIWLLGPLAARLGVSTIPMPGGCSLNKASRHVDLHIALLESMGARVRVEGGKITVEAHKGLSGADFTFSQKSVGATITGLLSASLAKGKTILRNCAQEPEIVSLCKALLSMGVKLSGEGTETLTVFHSSPKGAKCYVMPDRLEALTYMVAACATSGEMHIKGIEWNHIANVAPFLKKAGVNLSSTELGIKASRNGRLGPLDVSTAPHPGFPTDFQPIFASLLCKADGESSICENIYDNRFMYTEELKKMGARIRLSDCGKMAHIEGRAKLTGANVVAHDLRCGAALVIAALAAQGETIIEQAEKIDRGYQNIVEKLNNCGGRVARL